MSHSIQIPTDFPIAAKPQRADVVGLAKNGHWEMLNNVIICQDSNAKVTARFGQSIWNVIPYIAGSKTDKTAFDFTAFANAPALLLELKMIVYGWLFHKSGKVNKPAKISTLITRLANLKTTYTFLLNNSKSSLCALSNKENWAAFENALIKQKYAQGYLEVIFIAINCALFLQPWLNFDFGFNAILPVQLAKKLSNRVAQQTLVIPERLSDAIYGKAIELVEQGTLHHKKIAQLACDLRKNWRMGKEVIDSKIRLGEWKYLTDEAGNIIDNDSYSRSINGRMPQTMKAIIQAHLGDIDDLAHINNGNDLRRYHSQLITACYICCAAFSGMRDSELCELTPASYYCDTFEGRQFHMLQSRTFKLGEKNETWVTAPIANKAVQLATTLTHQWQDPIKDENSDHSNTLWLNQKDHYSAPSLIQDWNKRLKTFCKQFNFIVTLSDHKECIESNPHSIAKIEQYIKVGKPWHLTTHQFRRTLAFYTIKHRLGTTLSLKQQFKHLYLSMTEWYTNGGRLASLKSLKVDSELQTLLNNIGEEDTANKIFDMVHSDKILSGSHGKAIVKMRDNIPYIYSSWDVIYAAVKQKTLTLHGTGHSYCKSGYDCDMDGVVNPAFCVDCSQGSSIIDEECAKWWQTKHNALTTYLANQTDVSPTEYSHCITQIRAAETVMKDFNMPFTEYQHPIEIVQL